MTSSRLEEYVTDALKWNGGLRAVHYLLIAFQRDPRSKYNPQLLSYLFLEWVVDGVENKLEVRPGGEFSYQLAKTKLISIVMQFKQSERSSTSSLTPGSSNVLRGSADMDESAQRDAQIHLLNSIDFESTESVIDINWPIWMFT